MGTPSVKDVWRRRKGFKLYDTEPRMCSLVATSGKSEEMRGPHDNVCKCGYNVCSESGPCIPGRKIVTYKSGNVVINFSSMDFRVVNIAFKKAAAEMSNKLGGIKGTVFPFGAPSDEKEDF